MKPHNNSRCLNENLNYDVLNNKRCKPAIAKKRFRFINGIVIEIPPDNGDSLDNGNQIVCPSPISRDSEQDCSDKEHSESESISESEVLSKPECIARECLCFINQVHRCLTNLLYFKKELEDQFAEDADNARSLLNVFSQVDIIHALYQNILETIERLRSIQPDYYLYEVLLDKVVSNLLKTYKPFLSKYAENAKWMGEFYRQNPSCKDACDRVRKKFDINDNVNVDNCFYTVFNSLFSLELMFSRYQKCFEEGSEQYKGADDAKNLISNLLSEINTNQDQGNFLLTQKELNLLTGKSRESKINTRFVYKGIATKFARRDDRPLSRQLVLFTDCLYVTLLPGNIVGTSSVRQELSMSSMKVEVIPEDELSSISCLKWGLTINAREAVQDFFFDNEESMKTWRDKLHFVIKERFNLNSKDTRNIHNSLGAHGKEAPRWQKDSAAGYCNGYRCSQKFNAAIRRHHCRADGLLYCDLCCAFKVKLEFERSAESKVCELCFNIIHEHKDDPEQLKKSKDQLETVMNRRTHTGKKNGWLFVKSFNKDRNVFLAEIKYYCELDSADAFLKLYEKHEDKIQCKGIILLGMVIKTSRDVSKYFRSLSAKQFTIEHRDKVEVYLMKAPSQEECQKWVECLKERISTSIND